MTVVVLLVEVHPNQVQEEHPIQMYLHYHHHILAVQPAIHLQQVVAAVDAVQQANRQQKVAGLAEVVVVEPTIRRLPNLQRHPCILQPADYPNRQRKAVQGREQQELEQGLEQAQELEQVQTFPILQSHCH